MCVMCLGLPGTQSGLVCAVMLIYLTKAVWVISSLSDFDSASLPTPEELCVCACVYMWLDIITSKGAALCGIRCCSFSREKSQACLWSARSIGMLGLWAFHPGPA